MADIPTLPTSPIFGVDLPSNFLERRKYAVNNEHDYIPEKKKVGSNGLPIGDVDAGNKGYLAGQQDILNELIFQAEQEGDANAPSTLAVDDILGNKTRAAMDYFEKKGVYTTPVLFSAANVEQYKKNVQAMKDNRPLPHPIKSEGRKEDIKPPEPKQSSTPFLAKGLKSAAADQEKRNKGNVEWLKSQGYMPVSKKDIKLIDGDTGMFKGKKIRLVDVENSNAWFDAAESSYYREDERVGQAYRDKNGNYINSSKETLQKFVDKGDNVYIKSFGQGKYDRDLAAMYYQDPNNPYLYHSSDSTMVSQGEAVYGDRDRYPLTERQKRIRDNSEKAFRYSMNPAEWKRNYKKNKYNSSVIKLK